MNGALDRRVWSGLLASVMGLAALLGLFCQVGAQGPPQTGGLLAADPQPNALLARWPERITLTFAEPIDPEGASLRLLGAGGEDIALGLPAVEAGVVIAPITRPLVTLGAGDYTVVWSVRLARTGELLAGAYPFRGGVVANPGAAATDAEWPQPWATALRWLVFLGTALATGGFAWSRLLVPHPSARAPGRAMRAGTMVAGALLALAASALSPLLGRLLGSASVDAPLADSLRAMPIGWWIQLAALFVLAVLCLGALVGSTPGTLPAALDWAGLAAGLIALAGLSLTSHVAAPVDPPTLAFELVHQWSTALWVSGLLYLAAGWRGLGTDVARFRTVRWIGGVLLAISIVSGLVVTWPREASPWALLTSRYGLVLGGKGAVVIGTVVLGLLAMVIPRRSNAVRASRSLGMQGALAATAVFLSALLALLAAPGTVAPASLAGVALADVAPLDPAAFATERGIIHLLTQPAAPGAQTLAVRLTDASGIPLASQPAPEVVVSWTSFARYDADPNDAAQVVTLQPDPTGAIFTGAALLPSPGWWHADVTITPPGGVASRARFWLVLPDPNVTGHGPAAMSDPEARALFERGRQSLTSLHSVRYTQRLGDGEDTLYRAQMMVSAADDERPAAYDERVIDAAGSVVARQIIVGDRRWVLADDVGWVAAEPIPFLTPAAWGESYADATEFQLGPREDVNGELSQVVTFQVPPRDRPPRAPAWFAWWIGLASGEVRREAMVSTRHYMVYEYSDFDAPLTVVPPVAASSDATPAATPVP